MYKKAMEKRRVLVSIISFLKMYRFFTGLLFTINEEKCLPSQGKVNKSVDIYFDIAHHLQYPECIQSFFCESLGSTGALLLFASTYLILEREEKKQNLLCGT